MLSSGIFQVKLLKKNLELGISVACENYFILPPIQWLKKLINDIVTLDPKYWKTENYPYINEIKKGSVAYRLTVFIFFSLKKDQF